MSYILSVVVPTGADSTTLQKALEALAGSDLPRSFWELIVVDDCAGDSIAATAAPFADIVVRLAGRPRGPSYARNRGAEVATGEILVFIDADVCVRPDALRRFAWAFVSEPDVAAVYGSFGPEPESRGLVSRYRDMLDHYIHQRGRGVGDGFWSDCGAVRRDVFFSVGMFDEWRFRKPQVEAIELGSRLRDGGHRIASRPEIECRHLKQWTVIDMIKADLADRGVPRSRLLLKDGPVAPERFTKSPTADVIASLAAWIALLAGIFAGSLGDNRLLWVSLGFLGLALVLSWSFLYGFARREGLLLALASIPLHLLHHLLTGVALVLGVFLHHSIGDPQPSATDQAFSEVGVVKWPPVPRPMNSAPLPATKSPAPDRDPAG